MAGKVAVRANSLSQLVYVPMIHQDAIMSALGVSQPRMKTHWSHRERIGMMASGDQVHSPLTGGRSESAMTQISKDHQFGWIDVENGRC